MKFIIFILCLIAIFLLAYLVSFDRKMVKKKLVTIAIIIGIQILLAFTFLHTTIGIKIIGGASKAFEKLLGYANVGIEFVFGGMIEGGLATFVLTALLPIVFICALLGILQYFKVLPWFIKIMGFLLNKISRLGKLESYSAISAVIIGMTAVFVSIKDILPKLGKKQMYSIAACSISTVDLSIVGAYMNIIDPKFVILAIVLNLFSVFVILSIINPYNSDEENDVLAIVNNPTEKDERGFFEVLSDYMMDGFNLVLAIVAMLLGFVALIAFLNGVFDGIFGVDFQTILGYIFAPIAFLLGVPWDEAIRFGGLIATKLLSNEFVAMTSFMEMKDLSERSIGIISVFLVSFANFGSVGMIIGALKGLCPDQSKVVAGFSMRLLYGATLVSFLSAAVVGLVL
ncbi:NupC/NupG family nucleoside CNT transporter [Bacillus massiliigorillae]|uniref:NupC/NupG family nucleoside CNT transporter n=1 Tax=Bacillus massiliigorillae TaxID=1243664 RepID=UPI00039CE397|nr:nucleoside transporter C-terminal domain-containing protein [Bacillus massiliigorillae]